MKRKEELETSIFKLRQELSDIEQSERAAANAAYVGRCFRYRNHYSCPQAPEDYWWLYAAITGVNEVGLVAWTFQKDKYGEITINLAGRVPSITDGYEEISRGGLLDVWNGILSELSAPKF